MSIAEKSQPVIIILKSGIYCHLPAAVNGKLGVLNLDSEIDLAAT